jgi:hypothetical protein
MKRPIKPAASTRTWRASLIKDRQEFLGFVRASDRKSAEAAAIEQFHLSDEQRQRLMVHELAD